MAEALTEMLLAAGTALKPPLRFPVGSLNTTPQAGAMEYDGEVPYFSHAAGARGVLPALQYAAIQADFALQSSIAEQNAFPAANDLLTLVGDTSYFLEGQYLISCGSTSHITGMLFALAGGLTLTSIHYTALCFSSTSPQSPGTTQHTVFGKDANLQNVNVTTTNTWVMFSFRGVIRVNVGGTIAPQIRFSADPTGTNLMKVGSYIRFYPVGPGGVAAVGAWA